MPAFEADLTEKNAFTQEARRSRVRRLRHERIQHSISPSVRARMARAGSDGGTSSCSKMKSEHRTCHSPSRWKQQKEVLAPGLQVEPPGKMLSSAVPPPLAPKGIPPQRPLSAQMERPSAMKEKIESGGLGSKQQDTIQDPRSALFNQNLEVAIDANLASRRTIRDQLGNNTPRQGLNNHQREHNHHHYRRFDDTSNDRRWSSWSSSLRHHRRFRSIDHPQLPGTLLPQTNTPPNISTSHTLHKTNQQTHTSPLSKPRAYDDYIDNSINNFRRLNSANRNPTAVSQIRIPSPHLTRPSVHPNDANIRDLLRPNSRIRSLQRRQQEPHLQATDKRWTGDYNPHTAKTGQIDQATLRQTTPLEQPSGRPHPPPPISVLDIEQLSNNKLAKSTSMESDSSTKSTLSSTTMSSTASSRSKARIASKSCHNDNNKDRETPKQANQFHDPATAKYSKTFQGQVAEKKSLLSNEGSDYNDSLNNTSKLGDPLAERHGQVDRERFPTLAAFLDRRNAKKHNIHGQSNASGEEVSLENDKRHASTRKGQNKVTKSNGAPKNDKYAHMVRMGLPPGAVRNSMARDGVDSADVEAFFSSIGTSDDASENISHNITSVKDDPEFSKYFKMLKAKIPRSWVRKVMSVDGKDPSVLNLDPERTFESQAIATHGDNMLKKKRMLKQKENSGDNGGLGLAAVAAHIVPTRRGDLPVVTFDSYVDNETTERNRSNGNYRAGSSPLSSPPPEITREIALAMAKRRILASNRNNVPPGKLPSTFRKVPGKGALLIFATDQGDPAASITSSSMAKSMTLKGVESGARKSGHTNDNGELGTASPATQRSSDGPPPLKDDPAFQKYFTMIKMGVPMGAVKNAMKRDGVDPSVMDGDHCKPVHTKSVNDLQMKDDPEYSKYFKMLRMNIPIHAVKQALIRDGKDPSIIDLDHEKSLASQDVGSNTTGDGPPLKDDPEYEKYFKMLTVKLPVGAVKQALVRDGKDPSIIDLDPNRSLSSQRQDKSNLDSGTTDKINKRNNGPKVLRKKLFWNPIDKSQINEESLWALVQSESASLEGLDYDTDEFKSLFTSTIDQHEKKSDDSGNKNSDNKDPEKKLSGTEVKKTKTEEKVRLIDARRNMNGSILLAKFKHDYRTVATSLNQLNPGCMGETELYALRQLLPTKDEALALRRYLPPPGSPKSEHDKAIDALGECEKYMAAMLDVSNASCKYDCLLYMTQFEERVSVVQEDLRTLICACNSVRTSEKLRRLFSYILRLGNQLNASGDDGSQKAVAAFTLDSLLKLDEAKAFDKKTSILQYLVSIVTKNDKEVLSVKDDLMPIKGAERIVIETIANSVREMEDGLKTVKSMINDCRKATNDVKRENSADLSSSFVEVFASNAAKSLLSLSDKVKEAKENFSTLLKYFGEKVDMSADEFFQTLNRFLSTLEAANRDFKRREEAKARQQRIAEKRKVREQALNTKASAKDGPTVQKVS